MHLMDRLSLKQVTAAGVGIACLAGLAMLHFTPAWAILLFAAAAAALSIASVDMGVLFTMISLSLPLIATAPAVGITFIAVTLVTLRYLGSSNARIFFIAGFALLGAYLGPVWAVAGISGCLLGIGGASLSAAFACFAVEALGLALGRQVFGGVVTGAGLRLVDLSKMPLNLLSPSWVGPSFRTLNADAVNSAFKTVTQNHMSIALLVQPLAWALGAIVARWLVGYLRRIGKSELAPVSAAVGTLVAVVGSLVFLPFVDDPHPVRFVWAVLSSLAAAPVVVIGWRRWMSPLLASASPTLASSMSLATEDADVDELLRLIASAEEKLSSQHTTHKTVMITDMKSFSRMTEEDGSLLSAQAIQRLRDLLLPVITSEGGSGKSTGGDGLVAAFDEPYSAVRAATRMQLVLEDYNRRHPDLREMMVRIGIASGEVVLDKNGRPFIGAALNLAARVMNLADGGQAFATAEVMRLAGQEFKSHSHGAFELKNIAQPIEVLEVLWRVGQKPVSPEDRLTA